MTLNNANNGGANLEGNTFLNRNRNPAYIYPSNTTTTTNNNNNLSPFVKSNNAITNVVTKPKSAILSYLNLNNKAREELEKRKMLKREEEEKEKKKRIDIQRDGKNLVFTFLKTELKRSTYRSLPYLFFFSFQS